MGAEPPVHAPPIYDLQKHNKERAMPQSQAPDKTVTQNDAQIVDLTATTTATPIPAPVPSLDEIRSSIKLRAGAADQELASLRAARDRINARIRAALTESVEAHRLLNSLEPRGKK